MNYELQKAVIETGLSYGSMDEIMVFLVVMSVVFVIIRAIYFEIIKPSSRLNAIYDIQKMLGKDIFEESEEECVLRDERFK